MSSEISSQIQTLIVRDFPFYGMEPFSRERIESLLNFQPDNEDVIFCSYPMGSIQDITVPIWKLQNPLSSLPLEAFFNCHSCPLLDYYGVFGLMFSTPPRLMRINLPYYLTPRNEKTKYIYVVKNPEDVILDSFNYITTLLGRALCFSEYFDDFVAGQLPYGDFFDHVLSWYEHKDDSNVILVSHEKMLGNGREEIVKIADFLELSINRMKHDEDFFEKNFSTEESDNTETVEGNVSDGSPISQSAADEMYNPESDGSTESSTEVGFADISIELTVWQKRILQKKIARKFGGTDIHLMWTNVDDE